MVHNGYFIKTSYEKPIKSYDPELSKKEKKLLYIDSM